MRSQIQKICGEIAGNFTVEPAPAVDESDLSLKKLDEYQVQLQELQKEKAIILFQPASCNLFLLQSSIWSLMIGFDCAEREVAQGT